VQELYGNKRMPEPKSNFLTPELKELLRELGEEATH
jgi:hypothetical protein